MKASFKFLILLLLPVSAFAQWLPDTLQVAIIKYKTEEKLQATYEPMMEYLGEQLGVPVKLAIVDGEHLAFDLINQNYDLGIFKPFPYLKGKVDFPGLEVFASHQVNNNNYYDGIIITEKESGIDRLIALKDKRFLFIKPTSTSGYSYPKGIFKEYDIDIDDNFFDYDFSYNHGDAIKALKDGQADGIAVSLDAFRAQDSLTFSQVNVLSEYKVPHHAYVFSPSLDSTFQEKVKAIMFNAHKTPEGRDIFQNPLNITKWQAQTDDYYNYLRRYLRIVRVKPAIDVKFELKESARKYLSEQGDMIDIIKDNLYNELLASQRFSKLSKNDSRVKQVSVTLSKIKKGEFHYQIYLDDDRIAESDIQEEELINALPQITTASVLIHFPIVTELLSNDEHVFITYGENDGLNSNNYMYYAIDQNGKEQELELTGISELNTYFDHTDLGEHTKLEARYVTDAYKESQVSVLDQLDTENFWKDSFWDKLGLVVGILIAIASAAIGWFLNTRKKRRFQGMLTETNMLLKTYYEDKIKLDQRLDELKDTISNELHRGNITENQFLILKQKLDEVEINVRNKTSDEIDDILKDSGITPPKEE